MKTKVTAVIMILALGLAAGYAFRSDNRADAAAGNCYSDAKGPNEPTICN